MGRKKKQSQRRHQQCRPRFGSVHVQLRRHLAQQHSHSQNGEPEDRFKEHEPRDVGEHLVAPVRHGSVRMNR